MVVALESLGENAVNLFHSGIFIFSMKNKRVNRCNTNSSIRIAGFHKDREQNATSHPACCDFGQQSNYSGESCQLGCYLIYLCLIKHIAGLH